MLYPPSNLVILRGAEHLLFVPLIVAGDDGTTYTLNLPGDHGIALPGYYMLSAINHQDVPSVAATVLVQ